MSASVNVLLYGTAGCHLCDQAEALLKADGLVAEPVDIAADDGLIDLKEPLIKSAMSRVGLDQRFPNGSRIPVLKRSDSGAELDWPFDACELCDFMS